MTEEQFKALLRHSCPHLSEDQADITLELLAGMAAEKEQPETEIEEIGPGIFEIRIRKRLKFRVPEPLHRLGKE